MEKILIVDINADVGEGVGNEAELMPYLSSCNIACGGHAGDLDAMRYVLKLAIRHNVKIGAHPSFPDKENFGRLPMDMACADLYTSLKSQIRTLMGVLREEHQVLHHIKPHGALYNMMRTNEKLANVVIEVVKSISAPVKLYVPFKSVIAKNAMAANIPIIYEAFADRNYNDDLSLVSRSKNNALIEDKAAVFDHVFRMVSTKKVKSISGREVPIEAQTFCVHGDHENAVDILRFIVQKLLQNNINIL